MTASNSTDTHDLPDMADTDLLRVRLIPFWIGMES